MLLRNSISNTKKLFQKTLESVKSFFSCGSYQKLPKIPNFNPYSCSSTTANAMNSQTTHQELQQFYADFTHIWESDKDKANKRIINKKKGTTTSLLSSSQTPPKQEKEDFIINGSFMHFSKASPAKNNQIQRREDTDHYKMKISSTVHEAKRQQEDSCSKGRSFLVAQKLRELEMIDVSNVDHVLDIEEVLHYYSRLTCPAYLDIVDKFFFEIYAEFFRLPATPKSINSRPKLR